VTSGTDQAEVASVAGGLPSGYRRTALSGYALTVTSVLVALLATPLLARALGPERFGIWSVVGAGVLYLEVLELGFGAATISAVAERAAVGDDRGVRHAVATSFWLLALPGLLAFGVSGAAAAALPHLLDIAPADLPAARLLVLVLALDLAVSIPSDSFGGALAALKRLDLVSLSLLVTGVCQALAWVGVLAGGGGLVALGVVTAVLGLAGQLSRFLLLRRIAPGLSLSVREVQRDLVRPMARISGWFALSDVNKIVVQRIDVLLVGAVVGIRAAGIYAVGQKLAVFVLRAVEPATVVFFPHVARLRALGDGDAVRATLLVGTRLTLAISAPLCLVLAFFAGPLLRLWVGSEYAAAVPVVVLLALAGVVGSIAASAQLVLKGLRQARAAGLGAALDATVNLGLSVVLGIAVGGWGIALATLVAACVAVVVLLPSACRHAGLPLGSLLGSLLRAHVPPAAAAAALAVLFRILTPAPGLLVVAEVLVVLVVHVGLLTRTALEPAARDDLRRRLGALRARVRRTDAAQPAPPAPPAP